MIKEAIKKAKIFYFEKAVIPFNRWESFIGFKIDNKIPRLIIHEKFKKQVKWFTRALTALGILSSLVYMSAWYLNLLLALLLFAFQWTLEKVIFRFTTIFITPLPDFKWDKKEWNAMGYMYTHDLNKPSFFGPAFLNKDFGCKVFELLSSWNYEQNADKEGNIVISFIEDRESYRVYFYPSENRKTLRDFEQRIKETDENKGKDHHQLIVQMILCQSFPLKQNSNYFIWKKLFLAGQPAGLGVFTYREANKLAEPIEDILPILVQKINFKKRDELSKKDIEFSHERYVIGT